MRSQDKKKLIKVNEIKIESVKDGNSFIYSDTTDLGTYKSKERAIEVLDEIQNILQPIVIYKEPKIEYNDDFIQQISQNISVHSTQQVEMKLKQVGQIVYEMPKE